MATKAVPIKEGSACCPCPSQSGCSCGGGTCAIECRSKSEIADLCGWSEYGTPSMPPKKYRKQRFDEDFIFCSWDNNSCSGDGAPSRNVVSNGTAIFSKSACAKTTSESRDVYGSGGPPCPAAPSVYAFTDSTAFADQDLSSVPAVVAGGMALASASQTLLQYSPNHLCYGSGVGGSGKSTSGTIQWELSDEDTEDDAIERANAGIADWTSSNCLTAPAFKVERTTGFTFAYRYVESRVHLTGLTPSHDYDVTTRYFRRLLGSTGPWIFFSLNTQSFSSGITGEGYTDWVEVPNEPDFDTRAQSCTVEDVTL